MARDPRHLPWEQAVDLSARLAAIPVFERPPPGSFESEVLTRFFSPLDCEGATLTDQLLARYRKAELHVATLGQSAQAGLSAQMKDLRERVELSDCAKCAAGGSGHTCLGQDEDKDDAQLAKPGLCLSVLHEMFADVVSRYTRAIRHWAFEDDPSYGMDLEVYLSTRARPESAYDRAGPEWKIGGSTRFLDGPVGRTSEINLSIGIDTLDWSSMCSAFWVLVHEFVCHAQQGRPGTDPREPCRKSCRFFEGWMDAIALRLLQADLDRLLFGLSTSDFVRQYGQRLSQAAGDFRSSRYGWGPSAPRHKLAKEWDMGVEAVNVVERFLLTFVPPGTPAVEADTLPKLVRLSFQVVRHAPEPELAGQLIDWLLAAPTVVHGLGKDAQGRLYDLLTQSIDDFKIWINKIRSIAALTDHVK